MYLSWLSALALLTSNQAQATPTTFQLDAANSRLLVQVFKEDSALSDLAHDHVVLATGWSGNATLDVGDEGEIASCSVKVAVPVSGLQPDLPAERKALGMTVMLTESQQAQVKEHMLDDGQLDAKAHGQVRFSSSNCSGSLSELSVEGNLEIREKQVPVTLALSAKVTENKLTAKGGFSTTHEALGIKPYSAFLGTLKNQQKLVFQMDITGVAQ